MHLSHVINNWLLDSDDVLSRKTAFIGQTNNYVLCNFSLLDAVTRDV